MSTRSGKRIHSSFHENSLKPEIEAVAQSERKTRSRRFKENVEEFSVSVVKTKKRANYVSYPPDDEAETDTVNSKKEEVKPVRSLLKNALKEQNLVESSTESADHSNDVLKPVRTTRRTRKFAEDTKDAQEDVIHIEEVVKHEGKRSKKEKKKKKSIPDEIVEGIMSKKKSKKKLKKPKTSGTMIVEDVVAENSVRGKLNRSNMSVDSFHSAAGSPHKHDEENGKSVIISPIKDLEGDATLKNAKTPDKYEGRQTRSSTRVSRINISQSTIDTVVKSSQKRKSSFRDLDKTFGEETDINPELEEIDTTLNNIPKKRKSSIRDTVSRKNADPGSDEELKGSTYDLEDLEKRKSVIQTVINTTYDKSETPKSMVTDTVLHENEQKQDSLISTSKTQTPQLKLNSTYDKSNCTSPIELITDFLKEKPAQQNTFQKNYSKTDSITRISAIVNTTYEKDSDTDTKQNPIRQKSLILDDTYDKNDSSDILSETEYSSMHLRKSTLLKQSTEMNSTYDKTEKKDSTFDIDKNPDSAFEKDKSPALNKHRKLDTTLDKNSKSSLISSDYSNITLDKSDISRISITSDDSKENIVNTTPVLIESSMDESQIDMSKISTKTESKLNTSKKDSERDSKISSKTLPITPLKREGTFTKDGSDIHENQIDLPKTPTRKMSLPSPGCTPFPTKSGSKDKSLMNVTRSLEKSRRSSLGSAPPRATRVMFCSPSHNPAAAAQQRRKVIKSNLKGSNKSFVFEDSAPELRAAPRKRSYTHSDAEEARAKRHRLADAAQPLGRRSRARTTSATAKPTDPSTPSKSTTTTPKKSESKISRTKLPNFAAMHQREFAKMESLDECQERKARRAKQLLTPTGAVTVLERSSPKELTGPDKSGEAKKSLNLQNGDCKEQNSAKRTKETKKPETPIKSLPTLKSLNPGYTRFGFKLNYDVNPFTVTSKIDQNTSQTFSNKKNTVKKDLTRPLKEIRGVKRHTTLPSLTGATSAREVAKQTVMREKSFTDKRNKTRNENRTVIKGVRTNRRFDLQMKMRNIE